jgi:hypothetical protein
MDELLHTLDHDNLELLSAECKELALNALENGKVIYFPSYSFSMSPDEKNLLLSDKLLDGKHKNISFDYRTKKLGGFRQDNINASLTAVLHPFMQRYAEYSKHLIDTALPQYQGALLWGRTSYRPAEIKGRASSKRKDDTRLHVDSFPATPVNGQRILRVFCNVNPYNEPRVWHLGEPFPEVLKRFAPDLANYNRTRAKLLHLVKATKTLRSAYDHYQLHLHDSMKLSDPYQQSVQKHRFDFPAQSTWIVFTDQVSHAALSGQYLLEQTFYLPVEAMSEPELSPLKHWEREKEAVCTM